MKVNINTILVGEKVVLVPYRAEHVPKYHSWMLSEELRTLTASESLSLEEEYEMQQKWQIDEDKLTFIILVRDVPDEDCLETEDKLDPTDPRLSKLPMAGDVNLFLKGVPPSSQTWDKKPISNSGGEEDDDEFEAEVEIMIAEPNCRRKGLAIDTLRLMLTYATGDPQAFDFSPTYPIDSPLKLSPEALVTRISQTNEPSIRLFEKLGFKITKTVEIFQEIEMRWRK